MNENRIIVALAADGMNTTPLMNIKAVNIHRMTVQNLLGR